MTEEDSNSKEYKLCSKCNQKPIFAYGFCLRCHRLRRCEQAPKKLCECHCGEWIPSITQSGKPARFKKGHSQRGINNSFYGKRHSDEVIERFKRRAHSSVKKKYTKPEKILEEELNNANIYFIVQKIFDIRNTIHPVDFFIPPNICIEVDGERWHTRLIHGLTGKVNLNRDYIIDYELEKQEYRVLRFWESDVINNRQWVINQILKIIGKNYTINEWIYCICKCGQKLRKYDRWGRRRYSIQHHYSRKDWSNTYCLDCGSNTTAFNKTNYPIWRKYKDGYICRKCSYKYQYEKWRENNPLKGRHKDMSKRYCKLCNSKKTSLKWDKKRSKFYPAWFKYEDGWMCKNCKDRIWWRKNRERKIRENGILIKTPPKNRLCYWCKEKTYINKNGYEYWHHIGSNRHICNKCHKKTKTKSYIINNV